MPRMALYVARNIKGHSGQEPFFHLHRLTQKPEWVLCALLSTKGRLAQLARASGLHPEGRRFESSTAHHPSLGAERKAKDATP